MEKSNISRKVRRKAEQKNELASQVKKGTTVFGSALIVSTMATPALLPAVAEATNDNEVTSAEVNQAQATESSAASTPTTDTEAPAVSQPSETSAASDLQTAPQETQKITENTGEVIPESAVESSIAKANLPENKAIAPRALSATVRSMSPAAFIAEIAAHAQPVAAANDLYASVMMAQAIVESSWGGSTLSQAPNYNLFGIKGSYQGQTVYMDTWEFLNGQWVIKKEPFRKYPSYQESFQDNAYVLRTTSFQAGVYYYSGTWKSNTTSYKDATAWLTGRYATDPNYGAKLNNIISAYNLTQYDTLAANNNTGSNNANSGNSNNNNTNNNINNNTGGTSTTDSYHTVKAGDSLWLLATQYNTTIANIKAWNHLSGDTIYVGQKLIVKKGSAGNAGDNNGSINPGGSANNGNTNGAASYYTVKSGDTLSAIAFRHGISLANLRAWNNISGDLIFPGQKLVVKKGSAGNAGGNNGSINPGGSANTGNTNGAASYYTVKSGDTLSAIAFRHGISLANLRAWNNISGDLIFPGQKLVVKKGSAGNAGGNNGHINPGGSANNTNTNGAASYYTVRAGDTLSAIAFRHGISLANLRAWNNASSDLIFPGQKLIVKKGANNNNVANNVVTNGAGQKNHTVRSGDTLWDLAQQYNTSITKIKQLNGLSGDTIYIGQVLKIN